MAYITGFPSNSNITTTLESVSGNISAGGVLTNNLYYANGQPWNFGGGGSGSPGGSNTQLQFNNQNNFGGSANLTYDVGTNQVTLGFPEVVDTGLGLVAGSRTLTDYSTYDLAVASAVLIVPVYADPPKVLRSTNGGSSWTEVSISSATTSYGISIATDNSSTFMLLTDNGNILRSTDLGLTWTRVQQNTFSSSGSIRYANGTWFVFQRYYDFTSTDKTYYYSTNGTTWSTATITFDESYRYILDIVYDGSRYVLLSSYSSFYSTTGTGSWTQGGNYNGNDSLTSDNAGTVLATNINRDYLGYGTPATYTVNHGASWTNLPNSPLWTGGSVYGNSTWFFIGNPGGGYPYYGQWTDPWYIAVISGSVTNPETRYTSNVTGLPTKIVYDSTNNLVYLLAGVGLYRFDPAGGSTTPGTGNLSVGINVNIGKAISINNDFGPANGIMLGQAGNQATWVSTTNLFNNQFSNYTGTFGTFDRSYYGYISGPTINSYQTNLGNLEIAGAIWRQTSPGGSSPYYSDVNRWKTAVGNIYYNPATNSNYNNVVTVGWLGPNTQSHTSYPTLTGVGSGNAFIEYFEYLNNNYRYGIIQGNNYQATYSRYNYDIGIIINDPDLPQQSFVASNTSYSSTSVNYSMAGDPPGLLIGTTVNIGAPDGPRGVVTERTFSYGSNSTVKISPNPLISDTTTIYYQTGYGLGNLLLTAVCWSSNSYVAVGSMTGASLSANDNGALIILNSTNGKLWTQTNKIQTIGTFDNARAQDILWTGSELILVGDGGAGSTTNSMIYRTANSQGGGTWTQVTTTGLTKLRLWQLMKLQGSQQQSPAQIVALGSDFTAQAGGQIRSYVYYSNTGGTTWTQQQVTGPGTNLNANTIVYNNVPSMYMYQYDETYNNQKTYYGIGLVGTWASSVTGTTPDIFRLVITYFQADYTTLYSPGGISGSQYIFSGTTVTTNRFNNTQLIMLVGQTLPDESGNVYPTLSIQTYLSPGASYSDITSRLPTDTTVPAAEEQPAIFRLKTIASAVYDSTNTDLIGHLYGSRNWILLSGHEQYTNSRGNVVLTSFSTYSGTSVLNNQLYADNGTGLVGQALISQGDGRAPYWGNVATGSGGGGGTPGGSNTQVQFNSSGTFAGSSTFTFDEANAVVQVGGNVLATGFQANGAGELKISGSGNVTIRPRENLIGTSRIELRATDIYAGNIALANGLGNVTANYYYGNGTQLSNVATTNWTGASAIEVNSIFTAQLSSTPITTLLAGQTFTVDNNLTSLLVYNSDGNSVRTPIGTYRCLGYLYNESVLQTALFTKIA